MKLKLDRIISIATLVAVVAIFLVLKKPAPVAAQAPAATVSSAQPSGQTMEQREQATQQASPASGNYAAALAADAASIAESANRRFESSAEGGAAVQLGRDQRVTAGCQSAGGGELSPDSEVGNGAPNIKDQQVTYDGDVSTDDFSPRSRGKMSG